MEIIGYIIYGLSILITLGWCLQIREKAKREQATEGSMELSGFLMTVSIILIPLLHLSPFNLIWMLPVSFILGLLSMTTPIRLLYIFSSNYFLLWYLGINNLGRKFYNDGEYDKAIDAFKTEISKNPSSVEAHFNLALAYGKIEQHENEISAYEEAIKLNPKRPEFYYNLGIIYNTIDNKQKAISFLNEAIRLKPGHLNAHFVLCKTYFEIGRLDKAIEEYEVVNKLNSRAGEELAVLLM